MIDEIDERNERNVIDLEEEMRQRGYIPNAGQLENIEFPRGLKLPESIKRAMDERENNANQGSDSTF